MRRINSSFPGSSSVRMQSVQVREDCLEFDWQARVTCVPAEETTAKRSGARDEYQYSQEFT